VTVVFKFVEKELVINPSHPNPLEFFPSKLMGFHINLAIQPALPFANSKPEFHHYQSSTTHTVKHLPPV